MSRQPLGEQRAPVDPERAMDETEQPSALLQSDQSEELVRTRRWRFDQFTALGFDLDDAAQLADDALVDLSQARRLIALGCPLATASRILH